MMLEEQTVTERHDYASMTLEELAASANEDGRRVKEAERAAAQILFEGVRRALDAGDALLAAQARVERGAWGEWVEENFQFSWACASRWMRLAEHRSRIEEWIITGGDGGQGSIEEALRVISHLPSRPRGVAKFPRQTKDHAVRLRRDGVEINEIAEIFSAAPETVKRWVDPAYDRRKKEVDRRAARRKREASKALKEKREREEKAKLAASPSDVGKAYSLVRQLTSALSQAQIAIESPEVRRHLREAEQLALKAEESIWRANQEMQTDA